MKFSNDRQRKAMFAQLNCAGLHTPKECGNFANMNMFSKGRVPKIGEKVWVPGDPSVGMFPYEGVVVKTYGMSAVIKDKQGNEDELALQDFEDEVSLDELKKFEESMHREWLEEAASRDRRISKGMPIPKPKIIDLILDNKMSPEDATTQDLEKALMYLAERPRVYLNKEESDAAMGLIGDIDQELSDRDLNGETVMDARFPHFPKKGGLKIP